VVPLPPLLLGNRFLLGGDIVRRLLLLGVSGGGRNFPSRANYLARSAGRSMLRSQPNREETMRNRRDFLLAGSAAAGLAAFGWARPAWAPVCPGCVTRSLLLPLSGLFFFSPPVPIGGFAGEDVALAGDVHAVAMVSMGPTTWQANFHLNMAGVQGQGQTTSDLYIGTGSQSLMGIQFPPQTIGGVPPDPIFPVFTLQPTQGLASVPLPVTFQPYFDAAGNLLASSTVTLTVT
jgi:hypothetical protein